MNTRLDEARILNDHEPFITRIASAFRSGGSIEDLEQEARIAFLQALRAHDPEKGASLRTLAFNRIIWRLSHVCRRETFMHKGERKRKRQSPPFVSLDAEQGEGGGTLHDLLKCERPNQFSALSSCEDAEIVTRLVSSLPARSRRMLLAHVVEEETLSDIGAREGVSRERVRQICNQSLETLRKQVERAAA